MGNIANLTNLDLHGNQLTGEMPPHLGNLVNLTFLDLHGNQLSGDIPPELSNLTELTYLNLSGNQFSGEIPYELLKLLGELGYVSFEDLVFGKPEAVVGGVETLFGAMEYAFEMTDLAAGACTPPSGPVSVSQGVANLFILATPLLVVGFMKYSARRE